MNIKYIKTTDNKKYDLRDKRITDTDTGIATQSANGLLSSGDKKKLDGIASGAEVNQNAFSNIKIGNTTIVADGKTDTVELTAGNNITLTPDATNDKIIIAATDTNTTYTFKGGTNQFTVTPSNGTAQTVSVTPSIANNVTGSDLTANTIILGNGNSGVKKSGKTIVTTLGSDNTTVPTSKAVKAAIDALPEPMIFKGTLGKDGTITSLPAAAASNEGYTYKVITAGKYASQSAKVGDVFISNGSSWNLIPSGNEPSGTVTNVATGTGLTGGPITSSGTISHADTSSQASVSNSGRTYIQSITLDGMGHVTGITSATETVTNTDTKVTQRLFTRDGLMPLLFAAGQHNDTTADITDITYRNNSMYVLPSQGWIFANRFVGDFEGTLYGSAYEAQKLENIVSVGSATQPVYFKQGVPNACSYQLNKTVPSDAVFTDTTYSSKSEANGGTDVSLVTTGEKYNWNRKSNLVLGNTSYTALAGSTKYAGSSTQGGAATSAEKLTNTSNIGNTNQPVYFTASGVPTAISYTINETAPSSSSDDSTVPTSKAVWTAVSNGIATANAMIYRGTIAGGNTGAYGALTPFANRGWTYKVTTAGKINGKVVEIGDMLICNKDGTTAATSSNYSTIAANWDVIQANIDGAVTGPASSTNAHVAVFNGATGKVIKDSGFTIGKSVPSNAVFTDTHYTTHLYAGSGTAANAATTNGNTKLTVVDNTTTRNSVTIKGTGGTTVTSDANGVVTINSTDVSSKQFTFDNPQTTSSSGYDFIIIPNGYNSCPSGTCYFVEITALISKNSSWVTRYVKFMTHCKWYASNAGIRTTDPVCTYGYVSNSPIFYHDKAEGADVGTETHNSNVCIIPFNIPITSGLASVNIKVEGPNVSRCICDRSYSSWKWSSVEPSWTST